MIALLAGLVLAAPAPKEAIVELEFRLVAVGPTACVNAGVEKRLAEGAAILIAGRFHLLMGEAQNDPNSQVTQMPLVRVVAGKERKWGFGLPGDEEEFPVVVLVRQGRGELALEVRRVAASGKARVRHEAELKPGETLLFRIDGKLAAVTVRRVAK